MRFNSFIAKSTAFNDSDLWAEDTAISTLISPIGHVPSLWIMMTLVISNWLLIWENKRWNTVLKVKNCGKTAWRFVTSKKYILSAFRYLYTYFAHAIDSHLIIAFIRKRSDCFSFEIIPSCPQKWWYSSCAIMRRHMINIFIHWWIWSSKIFPTVYSITTWDS